MVPYLGDFAEDQSVFVAFNTFDSNDPSASVTITNLADTDIHIHKNDGTTQHSSATDVDVQIDFDTITGNHMVEIRTTDVFFTTAADYFVRMEGTTVDGATINAWIAHFSIENRFTNVTKVSGTSQTANDNGADINAILTDTNSLNDTKIPDTLSLANINSQVDDVLNTDAHAEPTGVPAANESLGTKIGYLFMALRNKVTVTSTKKQFYDDGDAAEWEKDLSDNGTTYTESEGNAI